MHINLRRLLISVFMLATASLSNAVPPDKKDPAESKDATPNYYPLQVGNKWTYRVDVAGKSITAVSTVAKIETIDGKPLARLESQVDGKAVATEHLRQTKDGVFRDRFAGHEASPPFCLLKYPLQSGSKWNGAYTVGNDKVKYSCEATEDNVEVTAGKYKAMRVMVNASLNDTMTIKTTYWFVKDIGYVKQVVEVAGLNIVMELEKFEPGKK